jgi:vacuolar-type H+-ATPase subunit H
MEAEGEAKRILQSAQTEAGHLVGEARLQANANEEQARAEVRLAVDTLLSDAVQAAETEKAAQLARAAQEVESSLRIEESLRCRAVDAVIACVAGTNPSG